MLYRFNATMRHFVITILMLLFYNFIISNEIFWNLNFKKIIFNCKIDNVERKIFLQVFYDLSSGQGRKIYSLSLHNKTLFYFASLL
jgi:hypothetical protein